MARKRKTNPTAEELLREHSEKWGAVMWEEDDVEHRFTIERICPYTKGDEEKLAKRVESNLTRLFRRISSIPDQLTLPKIRRKRRSAPPFTSQIVVEHWKKEETVIGISLLLPKNIGDQPLRDAVYILGSGLV